MPAVTIPARTGDYAFLKAGQSIKLTNPHGNQVIDFWAFTFPTAETTGDDIPTSFIRTPSSDPSAARTPFPFASGVQYFSASRTRSVLSKLVPSATKSDVLYTNKSLPLFTFIEDTTTGVHDTLFGCCDRFRYVNLGVQGYDHPSCAENMHVALRRAAENGLVEKGLISEEWTPDPLNVFMNVPIVTGLGREDGGGGIECRAPESKAGEYIVLRAERDVFAVMSACPNDVIKGVNAAKCTEAVYEVLESQRQVI